MPTGTDGAVSESSMILADGIPTRYQVTGSGPPLLMFSPGGFNAALENWQTHGIYRSTDMLAQLSEHFTCITFDKRESGLAGGRVEQVTWRDYARQGLALIDHLGYDRVHLMGGCIGCSIAAVFAVAYPERVARMVLYSPAGGVQYRMKQHARFTTHLAYVATQGLGQVVQLAAETDHGFSEDPRIGPWATVVRTDPDFAARYAQFDPGRYATIVTGMSRTLFDRDTVPGPEPENLLVMDTPALIVPGQDTSHSPSAAHYLRECLPEADYWDAPIVAQTARTAPARVADFLLSA